MGLRDVGDGYERRRDHEVEGGRLMFRGLLFMLKAFLVLWLVCAVVGIAVGHQDRRAGDHRAPTHQHRSHGSGR